MRVIAATNRNLDALSDDGVFRHDLLFRLKVLLLELPPLRTRGEDIRLLAEYCLRIFCQKYATEADDLAPSALEALGRYHWPGNVRELAHVIERAASLSDQPWIGPELLSLPARSGGEMQVDSGHDGLADLTLEEVDQRLIKQALRASRGNVSAATRKLGLSREVLRYRLQKHSIAPARLE